MTTLLDAALDYAGRGWPVFPLLEGTKIPKIAKKDGGRGFHDATTDAEQIRAWWSRWPKCNIGIRTGSASGLLVLDIDAQHGGFASLARLEARYGALPATNIVHTPSGGQHRYFAWPEGEIRNSASMLGEGLDIRGEGGYVVAPPSVLAKGCYR